MKLKNTLALSLAAVMAAGLTACGSGADTACGRSPLAEGAKNYSFSKSTSAFASPRSWVRLT